MADIIQRLKDAYAMGENADILRTLLPELFQAADEENIVVLPCKARDKVWTNWCGYPKEYVVMDIYICEYFTRYKVQTGATFEPKDIGKTVFLTREAAKAALKENKT